MSGTKSKSIIVLGMHRSRTSLVAKILMELGVFMGHAFRKPDEANPYGYWEDLAWRNINKTLLNASGHTWYNPPPVNDVYIDLAMSSGLYDDVRVMANGLVRLRKDYYPVWGFKDPRTVLTLKWLQGVFPDPHYVIVRRDRYEVALSLAMRASIRGYTRLPSDWLDIINIYDAHLCTFIGSLVDAKVHTIDSDDLVHPGGPTPVPAGSRRKAVERLADFIGVKPPDNIQEFMQNVSKNYMCDKAIK